MLQDWKSVQLKLDPRMMRKAVVYCHLLDALAMPGYLRELLHGQVSNARTLHRDTNSTHTIVVHTRDKNAHVDPYRIVHYR